MATCYVPLYKDCPICHGSRNCPNVFGTGYRECDKCDSTGTVKVLVPLQEYADLTGMSSEALHDLELYLDEK